jgi:hypothetical protein
VATRTLYQDQSVSLTPEDLIVRGTSRILGRPLRIPLSAILEFRVRSRAEYPDNQLPAWGEDDRGVWFARDSRRWRRAQAFEITLSDGEIIGISPAHPERLRELLLRAQVTQR